MGFRLYAFGIAVAASCGWASAALAEASGTSLSVGATVEPSCLVSTSDRSANSAAIACSTGGEAIVSTASNQPARVESRDRELPDAAPNDEAPQKSDVTYVTITY